jgi:hypothetical protein
MIQINNNYTQHMLTPEEQALGYYLTSEQRAVIQNDIADAAIQKAALTLDASNPQGVNKYIQAEAALTGQITILNYMLARANAIMRANEESNQG